MHAPSLPCSPASYGDRAGEITKIAEQRKLGRRIVRGYPILEAEVVYAGEPLALSAPSLRPSA